jgi:hypothetical protein
MLGPVRAAGNHYGMLGPGRARHGKGEISRASERLLSPQHCAAHTHISPQHCAAHTRTGSCTIESTLKTGRGQISNTGNNYSMIFSLDWLRPKEARYGGRERKGDLKTKREIILFSALRRTHTLTRAYVQRYSLEREKEREVSRADGRSLSSALRHTHSLANSSQNRSCVG